MNTDKIVEYTWVPYSRIRKWAPATAARTGSWYHHCHFHTHSAELGTRFKWGINWRLPFVPWTTNPLQIPNNFSLASSMKQEQKGYFACNHEVTFMNQWHIIVMPLYLAKLLSQTLMCLKLYSCDRHEWMVQTWAGKALSCTNTCLPDSSYLLILLKCWSEWKDCLY